MESEKTGMEDTQKTTENETFIEHSDKTEKKEECHNGRGWYGTIAGLMPTGMINTCITYLLFALNLYIVYVALFNRKFTNPLDTSSGKHAREESEVTVRAQSHLAPEDYGTCVFSLLLIIFGGVVLGWLVQFLRLPPLLGMILTGILLRNVPFSMFESIFLVKEWTTILRRMAFIVILLRGGLSLDTGALLKLKGACIRLAFLPCTVEAVTVAIASKFLLDMNILFGFILGFVLAAVSPAVVVPSMLEAANNGYGVDAGVPTLVVAAASLDDVYAITAFSVLIGVAFSQDLNPWLTVAKAPAEVIAGVMIGTVGGLVLHWFPVSSRNDSTLHMKRTPMLLCLSCSLFFGTAALSLDSMGAIAVMVMAFVAGHSWKKEGPLPEEVHLSFAWNLFFQPLLFGLIGYELNLGLMTLNSLGFSALVLLIGLVARTLTSTVAVLASGLCLKERIFVALSWLPKATVQAALGPVALDMCRAEMKGSGAALYKTHEYYEYSLQIVIVAVLAILFTAPVGAFIIRLTYPLLLKKDKSSESSVGLEAAVSSKEQ